MESGIDNELRLLVFDAQIFSLQYLCAVLHNCCNYKVKTTASTTSVETLQILRANKHGFDIVVVDVDTANPSAFKLLETIGLEMDLSVIMVTADGSEENIKKGLLHGAAGYIIKPLEVEQIKITIRDTLNKSRDSQQSSNHQNLKPSPSSNACIVVEESSNRKRERLVWTTELEAKFENAVRILEQGSEGSKRTMVHPLRILSVMNVPGLTREHVASHLQKYRLMKKRKAEMNQQRFGLGITNYRRKLEVGSSNADHLVVPNYNGVHSFSDMNPIFLGPTTGNTVMSSSESLPDMELPFQSLVYSYGSDQFQMPEINFESEHVSGTITYQSPYFHGVQSEPSITNNAAFNTSPNGFVSPEEANVGFQYSPYEVSSVPNLLHGTSMENSVQYPGSTMLANRNCETESVWNAGTTSTSPSGISSLLNIEPDNEVSEADKNQMKDSLWDGSFDWYSDLLNDE